jgi:membrane-bound lytic murein transglycosylase F
MVTKKPAQRSMRHRSHFWSWVLASVIAAPTGLFGSNQAYRYAPDALKAVFDSSSSPSTHLSPFDDIIQREAKKHRLDWRFVASMVFAESRFQYDAVSPAGARGLMQIMPAVAREHGVVSLERPDENVTAGIHHFLWGKKKLKGRTPEDATKLSLAVYNAGIGHVRDAQKLAIKMGKSPRLWNDVAEMLLLLEDPAHFEKAQYGFVNGTETVQYVDRVSKKFDLYRATYPAEPHALAQAALKKAKSDA